MGFCALTLEPTEINDWCADQDSEYKDGDMVGFLLCERECRVCGNINVYSAFNWGTDYCAFNH